MCSLKFAYKRVYNPLIISAALYPAHVGSKATTLGTGSKPTIVGDYSKAPVLEYSSNSTSSESFASTVNGHRRKSTILKFAAVLNDQNTQNVSETKHPTQTSFVPRDVSPAPFTTKSQISATFKPLGQKGSVPNRIKGINKQNHC